MLQSGWRSEGTTYTGAGSATDDTISLDVVEITVGFPLPSVQSTFEV
jgi:hypothetical protein